MPDFDALKYYAVLGAAPDSPISVIKKQYYDRAKYWHPDHNQAAEAQDMFQKVSTAYGVLQDSHNRLVYDLLCCIYQAKDFPLIGSLKIYKNQRDKDDKALRVLKQRHIKCGRCTETKDICNIREASSMVFATSVANWLGGWWGKGGWRKTIGALKNNLQTTSANDADNLKLLVHNAIAYEQEHNAEMSWIYAMQAIRMAPPQSRLAELLSRFVEISEYRPQKKITIPYWNVKLLKSQQLVLPFILSAICAVTAVVLLLRSGIMMSSDSAIGRYYEERVFADGSRMASDTVVNKILKTDSSPYSKEHLKHFRRECVVYHGPDEQYSIMLTAKKRQTIRVSGYTGDKRWAQIILDNGEMGYTLNECLRKGIGSPVPFGSKVYKGK